MTAFSGSPTPHHLARPAGRARWTMIWLAFGATTINYLDRANLGVALPYMTEELNLSKTGAGVLLGAFFWTYALTLLPSGWLVDRIGPRRMMVIAVAGWSVVTMLIGAASGFLVLLLLRLLLGAAESPSYPSSTKIVARWFPSKERAMAASIFDSGGRAGTALALPVITVVIAVVGWRGSFVAAGLLGLLFCALWLRVYRDPETHPRLSAEEHAYIKEGGGADAGSDVPPMAWAKLLRYRTTWGMIFGFFCLSFVLYFFITWFPSYLVDARGFDLLKLGIFGMLPALLAIPAQWLGGALQTRLINAGRSVSYARKVPLISGLVVSSVIVFAGVVESPAAALALLALSQCALCFAASSLWALPADVAPAPGNVASLAGIQGFASNIAGFVSPLVVGILLDSTGGSYVAPLAVAGGVALVGALVYAFVIGKIAPLGGAATGPAADAAPTPQQT
ncbi:MFS transporter [Spongiactinospora rosea]|uniref:MFS transporter n=1 Tax=Spongiactinospora rosea TaxID=2248750 RepID=A0A366LUK6_9ACTN|nr:MFS transporter [Spongiactinospora rosea]RBQ17628.1 MFS transporter [Spongiactinospora rosea]